MDHDEVREALEAQINVFVKARNESTDPDERTAANQAIALLEDEVNGLDILAANELGAKVDQIIEKLDEILDQQALDAASALGRTIRRLRDFVDERRGGG